MAAVLPGISHCLLTTALGLQSLNPVIISQPRVLRIKNVENVPHWLLLDLSPVLQAPSTVMATTALNVPTQVTLTAATKKAAGPDAVLPAKLTSRE